MPASFLPGLAEKWLARLKRSLSDKQIDHVRKFRSAEQKCLRLLCRIMALEYARSPAMLDMDADNRPFFRNSPGLAVSFCYAEKSAFCALFDARTDSAPRIAVDALPLSLTQGDSFALRNWTLKCLPENADKKAIENADRHVLQKFWLLQECCTKLYGMERSFQQAQELLALALHDAMFGGQSFYGRFLRNKGFLICLAASRKALR